MLPAAISPAQRGAKPDGADNRSDPALRLSSILDNPNVPTLPAVALQVVEKASRANFEPKEAVHLISQDPGLCSKVLKTVNSGLFGLARRVGSLQQAVTLLGARPLRSLVLSLSLPAMQTR